MRINNKKKAEIDETLEDVVKDIKKTGFAAIMETANGNAKKYRRKINTQLKPATNFFHHESGKKVTFAKVMAFYRKKELSTKQLEVLSNVNVWIHVKRYNHDLLENVIRKNLDTDYFKDNESEILKIIVQLSDIGQYFSASDYDLRTHSMRFKIKWDDYKKPIKELNGKIMELYTVDMVEHVIADRDIHKRVSYKKRHSRGSGEVDVIVACKKGSFYNAMERLRKREVKEYADTVEVTIKFKKDIT